jgi:hypothetical protein
MISMISRFVLFVFTPEGLAASVYFAVVIIIVVLLQRLLKELDLSKELKQKIETTNQPISLKKRVSNGFVKFPGLKKINGFYYIKNDYNVWFKEGMIITSPDGMNKEARTMSGGILGTCVGIITDIKRKEWLKEYSVFNEELKMWFYRDNDHDHNPPKGSVVEKITNDIYLIDE